ncbi:MAG: Shedu anti-phage system protein SduA domain-containing protein [Verrucomicrobiota bacterium]
MLVDDLNSALNASDGERDVAAFLRKNPEVVLWAFCKQGGHSMFVLHEFPIGIAYKADFVVPFSYSGTWEVFFVELEPVLDRVITKAGRPTQRLSSAVSQIGDWRDSVERNRPAIQRDLSDWCVRKDLLRFRKSKRPPSNYTGDLLKDPDSFIRFHYHVVIGRRSEITQEARRKLNQYRYSGAIEIRSYDLFLDIAENLDRHRLSPHESVYVAETKCDY